MMQLFGAKKGVSFVQRNRMVIVPAILVAIVSVLLILYSFYTMPHGHPQMPPSGEMPPSGGSPRPDEDGGSAGIFKFLGNIAIICGAVSYSWLRFKKTIKSSSQLLKTLGKKIYAAHAFLGWIALILVAIHGGYYLITDFHNQKTETGLAAFLILLTLAIYGWLYKREHNKLMRNMHFLLSNVWFIVLLLHAGGFFIMVAGIMLLLWAIIWIIQLTVKKSIAPIA